METLIDLLVRMSCELKEMPFIETNVFNGFDHFQNNREKHGFTVNNYVQTLIYGGSRHKLILAPFCC